MLCFDLIETIQWEYMQEEKKKKEEQDLVNRRMAGSPHIKPLFGGNK